jgi:hypothetical protein
MLSRNHVLELEVAKIHIVFFHIILTSLQFNLQNHALVSSISIFYAPQASDMMVGEK